MNRDTIVNETMDKLLTKAMGPRSMTEYAKACGVSPMSISRVKAGLKEGTVPSKKMCLKLASDPYVKSIGLTSRDFLEAAGYVDEEEVDSIVSYEQALTQKMDMIAVGLISKKLMERQATYQIVSSALEHECDFEVRISDDKVTTWSIILEENHVSTDQVRRLSYYYYLGRLFTLLPEKGKQYSMILKDKELYESLLQQIDRDMVKANVSVAYFDPMQMQVLQEDHFGKSDFISLIDDN